MAQSRLEKIGTIFSRVTGLLKSGAMKIEDKPLWYDVYEAFPPKLQPRFDRPAPNLKLRNIFYEEDIIRAHFHKINKGQDNINLKDTKSKTQCQKYIEIYNCLKADGALDDEKVKEVAYDMLRENLNPSENDTLSQNENSVEKDEVPHVNVKDLFN